MLQESTEYKNFNDSESLKSKDKYRQKIGKSIYVGTRKKDV